MGLPSSSSAHPIANPFATTLFADRDIAAVAGGARICPEALFDLAFDFRARPPAARERDLYQPSSMVSAQAWWLGPRDPGEWTLGAAGVELAHGDLIGTKVPELQVAEPRVEFARQVASVVLSALKDDARSRVGSDRLASRSGELAEVLVGQHQAEVVSAGFDQDLVQALRQMQVVLELIQVEAEVGPSRRRPPRPRHRRLPEAGDQESAEQLARLLAEQALGQRDEKDAAAVHAAGEVDGRGRLTHDVADRPPQQHRAQLVEDGPHHLKALPLRQPLILVPERTETDRVLDACGEDFPSSGLKQQQRDLAERASGSEEQRQHRRPQDVIGARAPEALIRLAEDGDQLIARDLVQIGILAVEDVEAHRPVAQGGVDELNAIPVPLRNPLQKRGHQVALGADDAHTAPGLEKAEDLALVARTARGGEACRCGVEASHVGWEMEEAGQLTGDQDHPAGWRHSPGDCFIETSTEPHASWPKAVGAIEASKRCE